MLENSTFQIAGTRRGEDGGTLHFRFEFVVPQYSEGVTPEKMELHSADALPEMAPVWPGSAAYFDHVPQSQPLPDSLPGFNQIGSGYRVNVEGSVSYKVRAEVPGMGAGWKSLWMGKMDNDVVVPVTNLIGKGISTDQVQWHSMRHRDEVRSLRLLPSHAEGRLSFKERTRSIFKKSALPSLGLTMTFQAPQTLFIDAADGDPLPFFLSIARTGATVGDGISRTTSAVGASPSNDNSALDDKGSISDSGSFYDIPTPKVYLTRLSVTLVAHSQVRTNPSTQRYMDPGQAESFSEHAIFEYRYQKQNEGDRRIELPLSEIGSSSSTSHAGYPGGEKSAELGSRPAPGGSQWSVGEQLGINHAMLRALGPSIVPDFATPNFARSYLVQWEVRVECCGEEVIWRSIKEGGLGISIQRQGVGAAGNLGDAGIVDLPVPAYGDGRGLVPGMETLNVNNVVAGASGEQLPSYERKPTY